MLRHPYLSPFLFALFPIFFIYSQNAYEAELQEVILPALFVTVATSILLFLFRVCNIEQNKTSIAVSALIFFFFLFGNIVALFSESIDIIGGFSLKSSTATFGIIIVSLIIIFFLLYNFRPSGKFITIINSIGSVLILFQVLQGGYVLASRGLSNDLEPVVQQETVKTDIIEGDFPDIYFIILDGYARNDVLREYYQYDNSEFLDFLKESNFYIADSSSSNYAQTLLSVAATMNLDYIQEIGDFYNLSHDRMPLAQKLWNNRFFELLRQRDYEIISFATGLNYTEFIDADLYLSPEISLSQFENILLSYTPIPYLIDLEKSQYDLHRERIFYAFDKLSEVTSKDQPSFVFVHLIAPHPPFVFDANGKSIEAARTYSITDGSGFLQHGGSVDEYISQYRGQVSYINRLTKEAIQKLMKKESEKKPVIIIQADHGPGSQTHWNLVERTNMHERLAILNAVYTPDNDTTSFYKTMTPINTFRLISNQYLDSEFPLLYDSSYFSTFSYPYHFYNVTDRLHSKEK